MFKTIESGSGGNCFLYGSLMIDLGLSYAKTKPYLEDVKYCLMTHFHEDHINDVVIRKVFVCHENIKFVCGGWMVKPLKKIGVDENRIIVVEFGKVYNLDDYKISPVLAYHDVENCGYRILHNGKKHLHITDTVTLDGIEAKGYDSASIECNHEINKALELIKQAKNNDEFSHLRGAINSHLSVDKVIKFCKENGIKRLIPVHIGNSTKNEVLQQLKGW